MGEQNVTTLRSHNELNTYSELPLDRLHEFLVSQVWVLPARLDLLWQLVLIPEAQERETKKEVINRKKCSSYKVPDMSCISAARSRCSMSFPVFARQLRNRLRRRRCIPRCAAAVADTRVNAYCLHD